MMEGIDLKGSVWCIGAVSESQLDWVSWKAP